MRPQIDVDIPEPFGELFKPHRYKVYYGGRGSSKSWSIARAIAYRGCMEPLRVLCAREIQRSISDSVHKLLKEQIEEIGMGRYYDITRDVIRGTNGTEIIFKGLRSNAQEIKSTEGIDICWVEEAQAVSAESWDVLIPTIRKPNSEIWLTFNPLDEQDPTYQRFVLNAPDDALVRKVNYDENPYFPEVLRREMEWLKARDYESYLHIWEGEVRKHSNAVIFAGRFRVEEFETPKDARFYHGADWGFACLVGDTVVPTDKGEKLLKDIKAGDMVLTREGYKTVIHSQSRGIKRVYAIDCGYKNAIIATEDHKIFTADGWRQVKDLRGTEKLCMMKSSLMARFIRGILTASTQIITTGNMGENVNMRYFTELYGNSIMGRFLTGATFTILTAIRLITALKTSYASLKANIKKSITRTNSVVFQRKKCRSIENFMDIQNKTGMNAERKHSKRRRSDAGFALNVESPLPLQTCIKNSVHQRAENTKTQGTVKKNTFANVAEKFLLHLLTVLERPALKSVPINLQSRGEKEVFDITVENGEYFANGVLVHNCDPTVLVRCYLKDRTIFIDREAWGVGVDLDETPALFDTIETARSWPIKADNARPETISFMKRRGFHISGAKKWAGSIEDGIEYLKSLDIVIHPRCRHTIDEFNHYSYKVDKQTGDILPLIVDAWNHCLTGDTLIACADGEKPIKDIKAGEYVHTRQGLKKVIWSGETRHNARVFSIIADGYKVTGTADHKIFTVNHGWLPIGHIQKGDILLCLRKPSKHTGRLGTDTRNQADDLTANISSAGRFGCTDTHGSESAAQYPPEWSSITKTETAKTTQSKTLNVYPVNSTAQDIRWKGNGSKNRLPCLTKSDRVHQLGIKAKKGTLGTLNTQNNSIGANITESRASVNNAERHLSRKSPTMNSVQTLAKAHGEGRQELTTWKEFAKYAASLSQSANTPTLNVVPVVVERVQGQSNLETVYDLTVEDAHEFFANGVLVHNCIDALRYSLDGLIKGRGQMQINPAALLMR